MTSWVYTCFDANLQPLIFLNPLIFLKPFFKLKQVNQNLTDHGKDKLHNVIFYDAFDHQRQ